MWRHGPKDDATSSADKNDLGFNAPRAGGGATKRYSHPENTRISAGDGIRQLDRRPRHRLHPSRAHGGARKGFACRGAYHFYILVTICIVLFIGAAWLHIWVSGGGLGPGGLIRGVSQGRKPFQGDLKFVPVNLLRRFAEQGGLDRIRSEPRFGVRPPRLAIVLGNLKKDPSSLMLLTLAKSLKELGYDLTVGLLNDQVFAIKDGEAHSLWHLIGCQISIFGPENTGYADWSIFEGIISSSLEAKEVISSLMLKPFESIPLVWIIEEDTLGKRLQLYEEMGAQHIIAEWRSAFNRADVVVFPDFSLPMLYTALDTGNFFVISGSPVDVWAAESYIMSNSRYELRKDNGFHEDDLVILVIGSYFFYDEFLWGFPTAMHAIGSRLKKLATVKNLGGSFKFVFLCGNSSDAHGAAFQEFALHLGFPDHSVRHYGMDGDVNSVLLMADTVLYGSFQDEQSFPPLLMRAMSFKIPIIAPDLPIIKKYVVDKVHGMLFQARNPETLTRALALLISDIKLSQLAYVVADYGRSHSKNMLAWGCISGYVKLLENVIQFPSDAFLPGPISQLQQRTWEWNLFADEIGKISSGMQQSSIVYSIEEELADMNTVKNSSDGSKNEIETLMQDSPTELDWQDIMEIEISEDFERREMQELDERIEKTSGPWDDIYRKARKAEKMKFEANERDEGELERTGQPLCIYEIYSGPGAWQFLHHSALYRGISLSKGARRSRSDDVDAVGRLRLLNETYYRDLLCEMGGMLSIANRVDKIHKIPWIGFQSWRAAGRKVSLSIEAEKVLEETIQNETKGDVIYYWARMDMQSANVNGNYDFNFWSMCDVLNGGNCRSVFEDAFRQMYGLPNDMAAVPPMPSNGDHWSSLHSWVMPTPSFLEFVMFSRMFVDALDNLNRNSSSNRHSCLLGSSKLEKRHCYCRVLELLVNVWAFHSARKMIYLDPVSGELKEQHRIEQRKGVMWAKFFNFTLLKSMDEDFAEEADDGIHPSDRWLWPLTGEVHWQGIFEREREERYRLKKDKHRKNQEKIIERQKFGYKQKTLGGRR